MKKLITVFLLVAMAAGTLFAQITDPVLLEAKAKLEVVYDLGRNFGFIYTMDKEQKKLVLTVTQAKALVLIADKILAARRIEPKMAEPWLVEIEDKILTPAQLMFVDGLAIERAATATTVAGTGAGSTGGTTPLQSYVSGGAFNPMLDATKTLGKDFKAAYDYLKAKK